MKHIVALLLLLISASFGDKLGVYEKLGEHVSLDIPFIDEKGKKTTLGEIMDGKPTIVTLNYYECPGICSPQLNDLAITLERLQLKENEDYKVITVSIHDGDTIALAKQKKKNHIVSINRPFDANAWHFVIGEGNSSKTLSDSVGFYYEKTVSPNGKIDYIHPATLVILSPEGKITRYLNGVDQLPFDVKMALVEASNGTVGPTIAKMLENCFAYEPKAKTYVFAWEKVIGLVMIVLVFGFFIYLVLTGRKRDTQNKGEIDE